ncbi:MAG: glycosyltransferase family 4 protein [Proteobacteria bacterium]|nr:glycosyltransferase family 4 protein [Pseudomonadota bacterium]
MGAGAAGPFFEKLVSMIAERGMTPDVTFAIDRTDIPDLLRTGDIFVLPSRQEGFGLALIEAMAAGLPVIASRTGGPATLVADRVNGLTFTPEEPEDLAEKIITLATDADLCATLVKAGYDTAARFSIAATLAAHRDLYCRLAR